MSTPSFHGFDPGEAKTWLRGVTTTPVASPPVMHTLHDVIALPAMPGLYDRDGRRIEEAAVRTVSHDAPLIRREKLHRVPGVVDLPDRFEEVHEPVLLGGHLMNHYGLFVIESMSRLWARDLYPSLPILFTTPRKWRGLPSYGTDIFNALGISSRVISVDKPTIFREVLCPGTAFEYRWKAFAIADEPHVAVARALDGASQRRWRQPVYLTRSGLPDAMRKSDAEPELEAELCRRGFEVVRAETLPLAEQIALFEQAPLIVGTLGSALHTALFSRSSGGRLGILNWGRGFENYVLVDAVKQHVSHYIKSIKRRSDEGEHVLDVGRTLHLLEEAGLIAASPPMPKLDRGTRGGLWREG